MLKVLTKQHQSDPSYDEMLRGRAKVFQSRMNWNVEVRDGRESDWYDCDAEPLYIVSLDQNGRVVGSLRVLPASGPIMLDRDFARMFRTRLEFDRTSTWECTRFCVHTRAREPSVSCHSVSVELLAGLCDLALQHETRNIVGVYERAMERVYRRIGWAPSLHTTSWPSFGEICCGVWDVTTPISDSLHAQLAEKSIQKLNIHSIPCNVTGIK